MRSNFEVRIFKLCRTIIVVEHTGVQWVQKKRTKYTKIIRVGRSVFTYKTVKSDHISAQNIMQYRSV